MKSTGCHYDNHMLNKICGTQKYQWSDLGSCTVVDKRIKLVQFNMISLLYLILFCSVNIDTVFYNWVFFHKESLFLYNFYLKIAMFFLLATWNTHLLLIYFIFTLSLLTIFSIESYKNTKNIYCFIYVPAIKQFKPGVMKSKLTSKTMNEPTLDK